MSVSLRYDNNGHTAIATLAAQGIAIPETTHVEMPVLPSDITQIDNEELMELFTSITAFLDFVNYQLALAEIEERALDRKLETRIAVVTAAQPKGLAAVIKATSLADFKVQELTEQYMVAHNYRKLIGAMSENLNRDSMLVSRELTRRTSDGTPMTRVRKFVS